MAALWLAFGGGFLSFISPCRLPLYPSFISYITGISVGDLKNRHAKHIKQSVMIHATGFFGRFFCDFLHIGFLCQLGWSAVFAIP